MATSFLVTLRGLYTPLRRDVIKFSKVVLASGSSRNLYAKTTLGIDAFVQQRQQVQNQMGNILNKFKEKMSSYTNESKTMIFTEDLKNMVYIAETDEDIELVVKMLIKFNSQNKQLRFGNFVFGPVVMRLFYMHNKADLALECFKSPELNGFFDQLITYQILLDLLYENKKYKDILATYEIIKERQLEAIKYPRNVIVLTLAACYKLNSKESLEYALNLWKDLTIDGHFPMRRAATFCAGLALNQGRPEVALEVVSVTKNPSYTTVRNIKVKALSDMGRVDDAILILKSILNDDTPRGVPHTFNKDVLESVKNAVLQLDNAEISLEFNRLENIFEKQGHISSLTLDEQLCMEIQPPPTVGNKQINRNSFYPANRNRYSFKQIPASRPGLKDMI